MPEKINIADLKIEVFANKTVKNYTKSLADKDSKLGLGSVAAEAAANSAALALRAIHMTGSEDEAVKKAAENIEQLRTYFLFLIDEENKAKLPLEKRLASGAPEAEIEGGYRTACAIVSEVLYTEVRLMELFAAVADKLCPCAASVAAASVYFGKTALECARLLLTLYSTKMNEDIYARTTRREPEIAIENSADMMNGMIKKFEAMI